MPELTTLVLFAVASIALFLIPGPVVLYTVARSINQGRQAGITSVFAAGLGDMCHVIAATLGLSALVLSSALAFDVVKYLGAAYLIYIGIRTLLEHDDHDDAVVVAPTKLSRIFTQGIVVSVLNPKTALFFLAFLPQFVDPVRGSVAFQVLILGVVFVPLGVVVNTLWALLASAVGGWLKGNRGFRRGQRFFAGGVYILLGVTTALTGKRAA